jgi:ribosomal-protein-serine acetyltransferase
VRTWQRQDEERTMSPPGSGPDRAAWLSDRPEPDLEVGDVAVRAWTRADGPALLLAVLESLQELRPWMPWATGAYGPGDAAAFVEHALASRADGREFLYAIVDPERRVVGACGLHPRLEPGGLEIGYWVHTAHTGRGLATRAAAALTALAMDVDGVTHVEVHHDRANHRSALIPRRLGFEPALTRTSEPAAPRETGVEVVWRLTRAAYAESPARGLVHPATESSHSRVPRPRPLP